MAKEHLSWAISGHGTGGHGTGGHARHRALLQPDRHRMCKNIFRGRFRGTAPGRARARHRLASSVLCIRQRPLFYPGAGVGCGPASDTKSKAKKAPGRSLPQRQITPGEIPGS
eukprot:253747-Prymnesium_polylepis.1